MRKCGFHKKHDDNCNTCNYSLAMNQKEENEKLRNAILRLKPHIWERYMEGESDYECAVIALLELVKEK